MTRHGPRAAALALALVVYLSPAPAVTASSWQVTTQGTPLTSVQDVDVLLAEAGKLLQSRKADDAKAAFERALAAAERLALEPEQAAALCGIGEAMSVNARYQDARAYGLRCLEIYERLSAPRGIGQANLLLNVVAELTGEYPEAEMRARRAMNTFESAGDLRDRAAATLNLLRVAKMDAAESDRLVARAVDDAHASEDRGIEASAFHVWGDGLFAGGRYEEAFKKLERAEGLYKELGNRRELGTIYNSLGRVYRAHGQLDEALRYQLMALDLHQGIGEPLQLIQSLNAVGAVHGMLGHVKESREFYERALQIALQSSSPRIQDFLRANIANLLNQQGEFARAADMLEQVIARGLDSNVAVRQSQLSNARLHLGQPREALAAAEKALEICGTAANDCILALLSRARARGALGDQTAALADITLALNGIEDVRKRLVPADFFKQEFHRALESIYSEAIAFNLRSNRDGPALETAELARSRAFADLLASRAAAPDGSPLLFRGSDTPAALKSLVTVAPASVGDIAASAARLGSTFLLYWVADDGLIAWVVTPDGTVRARRVNVLRSRLDELVRSTSPVTESGPVGPAAWRELYDLLIQPVRDALPRAPGGLITIVPHGPLQSLSFAALRDARGRYLLEDYTIHYAPAASVLQFTSAMQRSAGRTGDVLLVADPVTPARSRLDQPLPRLPGARTEAAAIARLVPGQRVTILRDTAASETGVRTAAAGKAVLHFATHAIVRDDDPFGSFLALGPGAGGADADGLLTAQEVYAWHLDADLVVLSACRSGGGRVTGDGVATFARAFIYAGTPSLVASLWDVADEPTNRLLPDFYRAWFGGQSKARALRMAQLQLLKDLRAGKVQIQTGAGLVTLPEHPVFWAGFVLIGEPH
jgi:CHAT domain-containing protein